MFTIILLIAACMFLALALKQGDPWWYSLGGQSHHPMGDVFLICAGLLVACTIIISFLAVAGVSIVMSTKDLALLVPVAAIYGALGVWLQLTG